MPVPTPNPVSRKTEEARYGVAFPNGTCALAADAGKNPTSPGGATAGSLAWLGETGGQSAPVSSDALTLWTWVELRTGGGNPG